MCADIAQCVNDGVISGVAIGIAVSETEQGVHPCCLSSITFVPVVTHKPYVFGFAIQLVCDRDVAFSRLLGTSVGVKPLIKERFEIAF